MVGLLSLVLACAGCGAEGGDPGGDFQGYNVLLVSIDTLRADRLGCYGHVEPTPNIDALAEHGYLFESMFTTSSTTFPAHVSLLTGLHPKDLRNGFFISDSVQTLAETLSEGGYETLAVVSALPLDARFNLDQGFARYDSDFSTCRGTAADTKWYAVHDYEVFECNAADTNRRVATLLDERTPQGPFFLWVHYFDPHHPYEPPPETYDPGRVSRTDFPFFLDATPEDLESLDALYGGEVRFVDRQFGVLLDELDRRGLREKTIVVVVADHGENLYEHDEFLTHTQVVYDTVMHVPFVVHLPGRAGGRIGGIAGLTDVTPTLLDLLGFESEGFEGDSLAASMTPGTPETSRRYVSCETNDFLMKDPDQTLAIRTADAKYIKNNWKRRGQLYFDVENDPGETRPLDRPPGGHSDELQSCFEDWRDRLKVGELALSKDLDEATMEAFRSLGYLQ